MEGVGGIWGAQPGARKARPLMAQDLKNNSNIVAYFKWNKSNSQ